MDSNARLIRFTLLDLLVLGHVQRFIDNFRNWLNLGAEFFFDSVQRQSILVGDQVDRNTEVTETTCVWERQTERENGLE